MGGGGACLLVFSGNEDVGVFKWSSVRDVRNMTGRDAVVPLVHFVVVV